MTENIDTYVMPEESDKFLAEVLPASDPLRITWEVLTDEEKEGYLSAALRKLEGIHFIGDKANFYQPLQFPRVARGLPVNFEKAPMEIKRAQALCAADIARGELYIRRRNKDFCVAFGLAAETPAPSATEKRLEELLHRWVTRCRKV